MPGTKSGRKPSPKRQYDKMACQVMDAMRDIDKAIRAHNPRAAYRLCDVRLEPALGALIDIQGEIDALG